MSASVGNVVALVTTPISEASPTGESVRLDAEFETLRALIERMYNEGVAGVDWKKVVELSTGILQKKSKDLLVLSYLCCGLFWQDGHAGLAEGLDAVHQLMTGQWDRLHPERVKARVSSVTWLSERVAAMLPQKQAKPADRESVQACLDKVNEIDSVLADKLGGDAPSLRDFMTALEEALSELPEPSAPAAAPGAAAPSSAPAGAPAILAPADDFSTPEGIAAAMGRAFGTLGDAARALRRGGSTDPLALRIPRLVVWSELRDLPPNDGGTTMIPAPDVAGATAQFEGMLAASQWTDLLEAAEVQFEQMALWLDVHRYTSAALQGLGGEFDLARAAVREELATLLRRLPGLADLRFSDGTPLASDATRGWIAGEVLAGGGSAGAGIAVPAGGGGAADEAFSEALKEARGLAKKKKMGEAISRLIGAADGAPSRRLRFERRLALARLLADGQENRLAAAILDGLEEEIRRFALDEWDPPSTVDALRLHLLVQRAMLGDGYEVNPEAVRKADEIFSRLARLDAATALRMQIKA